MKWLVVVAAACGGATAHAPLEHSGGVADTRDGEIEGEIVDAKTGEPLAGVTIVAMRDDHDVRTQISDAEGYFRLHALPAARYRLDIYYADATVHLADVVVAPGERATADYKLDASAAGEQVNATWHASPAKAHHVAKLSAGHGAVIGIVTTKQDARPLAALEVIATRGDGRELTSVTDHRGDFFFDDIAPGDYALAYRGPHAPSGTLGTMHVTAGQITDLDLTIEIVDEDRD